MAKDGVSKNSMLIGMIADEDTITGFLLAGTGHRDEKGQTNFLVVEPEKTRHEDIVAAFKSLTTRRDIAVILITQTIAQEIRYLIAEYDKTIPTILEVPSKDKPYDESKDPLMQRVIKLMGGRE